MAKTKMSLKRKTSSLRSQKAQREQKVMKAKESANVVIREDAGITEVDPISNLLDPNLIGSAIMQCLIENDPAGVMEIIESHLYALNKSKFLRKAKVPRSTMYQLLQRKNPTIKTLAKILYATHHK